MYLVIAMNDIFDCKLLVVDDEPELLKMLKNILYREGFRKLIVAANCTQARKLFASERPECVILDVTLPVGGWFLAMRNSREGRPHGPESFLLTMRRTPSSRIGIGATIIC
jgi:DNA-binding response OmpR family regulator